MFLLKIKYFGLILLKCNFLLWLKSDVLFPINFIVKTKYILKSTEPLFLIQ